MAALYDQTYAGVIWGQAGLLADTSATNVSRLVDALLRHVDRRAETGRSLATAAR